MPLVARGCERALLCQRFDDNARRLTIELAIPFSVVHLAGLAASLVEGELQCLIPQDMAKAKER
jgi:hypothetical protein